MNRETVSHVLAHPLVAVGVGALLGAMGATTLLVIGMQADIREIKTELKIVTDAHTKAIDKLESRVFGIAAPKQGTL